MFLLPNWNQCSVMKISSFFLRRLRINHLTHSLVFFNEKKGALEKLNFLKFCHLFTAVVIRHKFGSVFQIAFILVSLPRCPSSLPFETARTVSFGCSRFVGIGQVLLLPTFLTWIACLSFKTLFWSSSAGQACNVSCRLSLAEQKSTAHRLHGLLEAAVLQYFKLLFSKPLWNKLDFAGLNIALVHLQRFFG